MTCNEMIERIHSRGRFSGKPGLHRIQALMKALGDPQDQLKFVHVAGTNGKGSTCTMIASILQQSGYKVGLYTSPYLVNFHERIVVNNEMISDEALVRLSLHTEEAAKHLCLPPDEHIGEFEFVTAVAFQFFLEQKCDIVVLETGLGGSYDATNVIRVPEVAVITSISFDHVAVLGNTLEEIARTKAGIIKQGSIVVSSFGQNEAVYKVLKKHCPALIVPEKSVLIRKSVMGQTFTYKDGVYVTTLQGNYQIQNAATAIEVVKVLTSRGFEICQKHVYDGIKQAQIGARMEIVSQNPRIIIDGGHNEDGVRATVESLYTSGCKACKLVVGMVADKSIEMCVRQFASVAKQMIVTQPRNERALSADDLFRIASIYCKNVVAFYSLPEALDYVLMNAEPDDTIVICGSLYLAGEAKEYFANRQHSANLYE